MSGLAQRSAPRLSVKSFRGFLEGRPDEERCPVVLAEFGLRCKLSDLYQGTALQPC